jgi:DNA-binding MarR family transcriptional regulator
MLHDHGAMGQRELGQTIGVDPSILMTLLNPLEAGGFVLRCATRGPSGLACGLRE